MKKLAVLLSILLVAGVAVAAQAPAGQAPAKTKAVAATKTHVVEAEVVSADPTAMTLTIKGEPDNKTVKVDHAAMAQLKTVKTGDKVKLTCRDNEKGEHEAVTHIAHEKTAAKPK
jgi:hypothetical protein